MELYRSSFQPSADLDRPYAMVAASVIAAGTDELAHRFALPGGLAFLRLSAGRPGPLPSPEEAEAYPYTPIERAAVEDRLASQVIGGPEAVRRRLGELLARTQADELMITTMVHDHDARLRSYELVSDVLAGEPAAPLSSGAPEQPVLR